MFSMFSIVDTIEFPVHDVDVSTVNHTQKSATAVLEHGDGGQSTVTLVLVGGDWKIDRMKVNWESIGLPESMFEQSEEAPEPVAVENSADVPDSTDGSEGALSLHTTSAAQCVAYDSRQRRIRCIDTAVLQTFASTRLRHVEMRCLASAMALKSWRSCGFYELHLTSVCLASRRLCSHDHTASRYRP